MKCKMEKEKTTTVKGYCFVQLSVIQRKSNKIVKKIYSNLNFLLSLVDTGKLQRIVPVLELMSVELHQ